MNPVQIPPDGGKKMNVLGVPIVIRIHGRDTGGSLSVVESHDAPGAGPPPHIHHREDETFQVLEGEYGFRVGVQTILAGPGTTLCAPRGIVHPYRCVGKTSGKLMCVITPPGFEGFSELSFHILRRSPSRSRRIRRRKRIATGMPSSATAARKARAAGAKTAGASPG